MCSTYLDVMLLVMLCVQHIWMLLVMLFDIFGCYVDCHIVYLTYLDVMSCLSCCVMLCLTYLGCYVDCHVIVCI